MALRGQYSPSETLIRQAVESELERLRRLEEAWNAYNGDLQKPLKIDKYDDNVRINPARMIVNTSLYFLFGQSIAFDGDFENDSPPEWMTYLRKVWRANRQDGFLQLLGLNGSVAGHAFVKLLPDGAPRDRTLPRFVVLDPSNVKVKWSDDDYTVAEKYTITYTTLVDDPTRPGMAAVVRRQEIEYEDGQWVIEDYERDSDRSGTMQKVDERVWPYPWPPIVDCQNLPMPNVYYGSSDLEQDVVDTVKSLQFLMSNINKIIRIHAHPKTWAKGLSPDLASEVSISPDELIALPDPEAELRNLEMSSDLGSSINFMRELRQSLGEMTQTPKIATGETDSASSQLSGINLSILFAPLIQKTTMKRNLYGELILDLCHRVLELGGYADAKGIDSLRIVWPEAVPGSKYLERQTLTLDKELGVSVDTILTKLGYDVDTERTNRKLDSADSALGAGPMGANNLGGGNNNPVGTGNRIGSLGAAQTPQGSGQGE